MRTPATQRELISSAFSLGRLLSTPGAIDAAGHERILQCLRRHAAGDWGVMDADDKRQNDEAVEQGLRILSAYPIDESKPCAGHGDNTLWIITEADRSATTALLPSEY